MKKLTIGKTSFLQALGLFLYCLIVGLFFWNVNKIFPKMNSFLGPVLLLTIFVLSAIICTLIFGYRAFIIFWEEKNTKKAVRLILYTTGWLVVYIFLLFIMLLIVN